LLMDERTIPTSGGAPRTWNPCFRDWPYRSASRRPAPQLQVPVVARPRFEPAGNKPVAATVANGKGTCANCPEIVTGALGSGTAISCCGISPRTWPRNWTRCSTGFCDRWARAEPRWSRPMPSTQSVSCVRMDAQSCVHLSSRQWVGSRSSA